MALYYDLPVFKDVYKLALKIDYTKDFPPENEGQLSNTLLEGFQTLDGKIAC